MSEATAFVAGATGYVGRALVRTLCRQGVRCVAHVRPDSARRAEWREHFEGQGALVDGAAWQQGPMGAALRRHAPSHVFFLVGTTRARMRREGREQASYEAVDLGLARLLLEACRGLEPGPRFVYLSSWGAGARAPGAYLRARTRAEEAVRASGLPYTVARAGVIHGPDRDERRPAEAALALAMGAAARLCRVLGLEARAARCAPTDAAELAHGLVHAALNYTTIDRVLMPEELRYRLANDREYFVPASRKDELRH